MIDGWMDGWVNGWMDGLIKLSMNRWIDGLSTATPPPSSLEGCGILPLLTERILFDNMEEYRALLEIN